jgi:N utilization substance protein A
LADLAADELVELLPDAGLSEAEAGELIMAARAHWFGDGEDAAVGGPETTEAEPDPAADPGRTAVPGDVEHHG